MICVLQAKTIREFDKQFTSVMFGYPTIEDYYEDASPYHKLKSVGIPLLCLNSVDDVFSPGHGKLMLSCMFLYICSQFDRNYTDLRTGHICEVVSKNCICWHFAVRYSCYLLPIFHTELEVLRGSLQLIQST